ncbi:unknown protein [Waddlia chondrophila 2032/99]|uniref:Uncharacterized protein n=1 Tax=Waddlia chondrophila 2032/99 TaxID=765953 RepID=F8LAG1_9BACT|nr:unknown protein [Waddlia chondrophila 2032/99]
MNIDQLINAEAAIRSLFPCLCLYIGRREKNLKKNVELYFILYFGAYLFLLTPKFFSEEISLGPKAISQYTEHVEKQYFFESEKE